METIDGGSSELPVRLAVVIDGGRASKKLITDTGYNELSSSVDAVVSNDDLLIEILLRSPAISIIQWKSVSKRWLSLITTPTFASRRSQSPKLDPPSGLFFRRGSKSSSEYDFVSLDTRIPAITSPTTINFTMGSAAAGNVEILHSCNGLLLCRMGTYPDKTVYVCNPSINLFKMLPQQNYHPNIRGIHDGIKMAFDPTKSPHYKVIHAATIESRPSSIHIQIYSSETCKWSVCSVQFHPKYFSRGFSDGIYWNDALYWLSWLDQVCCLKLNIQKPILLTIKTPKALFRHCHDKLFESHGRLVLVCNDYNFFQYSNIYEMKNECDREWLWKYRVSLTSNVVKMYIKWYRSYVRAVVLREREDESFLVIEANGKMFRYNFMVKTLSNLFDSSVDENFDGLQFIASFAGV